MDNTIGRKEGLLEKSMKATDNMMKEALSAAARRPTQICCNGDTLFALMGNGRIRARYMDELEWRDLDEQPGDTMELDNGTEKR